MSSEGGADDTEHLTVRKSESERNVWIASQSTGPTVLEIGAVDSDLTSMLLRFGMRVWGCLEPALLDTGYRSLGSLQGRYPEQLRLLKGTEEILTGQGKWDTVVMDRGWEQLGDPVGCLRQIADTVGRQKVITAVQLSSFYPGLNALGPPPTTALHSPLKLKFLDEVVISIPGHGLEWVACWEPSDYGFDFLLRLASVSRTCLVDISKELARASPPVQYLRRRLGEVERENAAMRAAMAALTAGDREAYGQGEYNAHEVHGSGSEEASSKPHRRSLIRWPRKTAVRQHAKASSRPPQGTGPNERSLCLDGTGKKFEGRRGPSTKPRLGFNHPRLVVCSVGDSGTTWLDDGVKAWRWDDPTQRDEALVEVTAGRVDLVIIEKGTVAKAEYNRLRELLDRAANAGTWIVVSVTGKMPYDLGTAAWGDFWIGDVTDAWIPTVPPVDVTEINPVGWSQHPKQPVVSVLFSEGRWHVLSAAGSEPDTALGPGLWSQEDGSPIPTIAEVGPGSAEFMSFKSLLDHLKTVQGVVDVPEMHEDEWKRSRWLVQLCCAGIPVLTGSLSGREQQLLGGRLTQALNQITPHELQDRRLREEKSVELRRAAIMSHSKEARTRDIAELLSLPVWHYPLVTVVVPVGRRENLGHVLHQVAKQQYPRMELVLVFHGVFPSSSDQEALDGLVIPWRVAEAPNSWVLGDVLNLGTESAGGEIITKMDDDDWYGPDHVTDLVLGLLYSRADLSGKAAEFVYMGALDVTIRRFDTGAESPSRTLAGGALAITREALRLVGGWRRQPRSVDALLIADVIAAGLALHRTHGFAYILTRRSAGHTWDKEAEYFLNQSVEQRRGLDLEFAGFES